MKIAILLDKKSKFNIDLPEFEANNLYNHLVYAALGSEVIEINKNKNVESTEKTTMEEDHEYVLKRLVITKCPHCGETVATVVGIKDGQIASHKSLTCKKCQGEIPISELKLAIYECPNCNAKADFFIMGDLAEVRCKKCASVIDLVWNEKKRKYISANLVDKN